MDKNIEDLKDSEIEPMLVEFDTQLSQKPEAIFDEEVFSSEDLLDIVTAIHYLRVAGIVPDAESVYSNLYKSSVMEITRRLGELPYI